MHDILQIIILAVVQGLTEFLPVSSSGHLALTQHLFGIKEGNLLIALVLHAGTLLSILIIYARKLLACLTDKGERHLLLAVIVGTLPVALVGSAVEVSGIMNTLFSNMGVVGTGLIVTGIVLLTADMKKLDGKNTDGVTVKDALLIGLAQVPALFPGISRSGMTITAGIRRKLSPEAAAEFSFMLAVPAIAGASLLGPLLDMFSQNTEPAGVPFYMLAVGFAVSAAVGYAAIKLLLASIKKGGFRGYAFYCLLLGTGAVVSFFL